MRKHVANVSGLKYGFAGSSPAPSAIIFALFILSQIADAVVTYMGVHRFGIPAEGNRLVRWWMMTVGIDMGIVSFKFIPCVGGYFILRCARDGRRILISATVLTAVIAVLPWVLLLTGVL